MNKLILPPLAFLATMHAEAATNAFNNSTADGLWGTAANWSLGTVPGLSDNAVINAGRVVTLAANAPAADTITVGNTAHAATAMNIQADLTANHFRVATADGTFGSVNHTAGVLTITTGFQIAGNSPTPAAASYTISGGTLDFSAPANLLLGTQGTGSLTIDGSAVASVSGKTIVAGAQATLEFKLDTYGVTPIDLTGNLTLDAASQLVVDGTDYEALDGYFPLIKVAGTTATFGAGNVSFIGLADRAPALVYDSSGIWMRLGAPAAYSEKLLSLVPDSTIIPDFTDSQFSATRDFDPSGSQWSTQFHEAHVMDTLLAQEVLDGGAGQANRSWELRVARGGNIYSLRTPALGETVAPQYRSPDDNAPWIDEVWQSVAVDGGLNDPQNGSPYFIHQAGVYMKDPILTEPFYSPQVAARLDVADRSFTTINWGQQAHIQIFTDGNPNNDWQSHVLYFTRYKDLGQGLIEVSSGFYNYGPDHPDFFNAPWGGVRRTTTEYAFLASPLCDSLSTWSAPRTESFGPTTRSYNLTGGWMGFSASNTGASPSLGMVFARDSQPFLDQQTQNSLYRWGYAGGSYVPAETTWRNYFVSSNIRRYDLSQGRGFWSRYYITMGDNIADMSARITARNLAAGEELRSFAYTEGNTPLIGYSFTGSGTSFRVAEDNSTPQFYLYAHPVGGSFPIYEIIENNTSRYLSWNPYGTGVIKTYDGTIAGIRLLGFALKTADINSGGTGYTYQALAPVMAGVPDNYKPAGLEFSVRATGDTADDDDDGLANFIETSVHGSNPNKKDSDDDGYSDSVEVAIGSNPAINDSALIDLVKSVLGGETARIRLTPSGDDFTVTIKVKEGTDLATFTDLDLTGVNTTVNAATNTVEITISGSSASKFLRITE